MLGRYLLVIIATIALARGAPAAPGAGSAPTPIDSLLNHANQKARSGDLRGAHEVYRAAAAWALAAGDTVHSMEALRGAAFMSGGLGLASRSVEECREMLALAVAVHDAGRQASAHAGIAYQSMMQGDAARARAEYRSAVVLARAGDDPLAEIDPLIGLGRLYSAAGAVDSARACFKRAWVVAVDAGQESRAADALNNLGTLEHQYGDLVVAVHYYERALALHQASGDRAGAVTAVSNLALAETALGRYDDAVAMLEENLKICEAAGMRAGAGMVQKDLGYAFERAVRPAAAATSFRRALAMGDTLDAISRMDAAFGLADALATVDSVDAAIGVLITSLQESSPGLDRRAEASNRIALAWYLVMNGDADAALAQARRAVDDTATLPPGDVRAGAQLVRSVCLRMRGDPEAAMDAFESGVAVLEEARTLTHERAGRPYIKDLLSASEVLLEYPPERPMPQRVAAMFDVLERFRVGVNDGGTPGASAETQQRAATLQELQENILLPGDLLLEFYVVNRRTYLFAVTPDTVTCDFLPGLLSDFAHQVDDYCRAVAQRPAEGTASLAGIAGMQRAIGEQLLGGVADRVQGARRVIVVPDGFFHRLALGSLEIAGADGDSQALIEHAAVFRVPSASALAMSATGASGGDTGPFLVVSGSGDLRGARDETRALARRYAGVVTLQAPATAQSLCDHMEASRVIHVAAHVDVNDQKPWYSGILVGTPPATASSSVRSVSGHGPQILSIADSMRVALEFEDDPFLRAYRVADLDLAARLVVLAGCESALGQISLGEGVVGLSTAFMQAGVPTVVGSLWPIDDRTTASLMRAFYDGLADRLPVSDALRQAQRKLRADPETAQPFYWAGFVVVGDGGERVELDRRVPWALINGVGLPLVVLLIVGIRFRSRRAA